MKRRAWIAMAVLVVAVALVWRANNTGPVSLQKPAPDAPTGGLQAIPAPNPSNAIQAPTAAPATTQFPVAKPKQPSQSPVRQPAGKAPAVQPSPAAAPGVPDVQIEEVHTTIRDFRLQFGGNPVGTNAEITSALAGGNQKHTDFLTGRDFQRNAKGELIDRWGTPYFFHQVSGETMEVRSAGPDRVMWTDDDESM